MSTPSQPDSTMPSSTPISPEPIVIATSVSPSPNPESQPEPDRDPSSTSSTLRKTSNSSTTSLPILHPLNTIPENGRTNTLPIPAPSSLGATPIHPLRAAGRHSTFRYPVYPDTPFSGAPVIPYTGPHRRYTSSGAEARPSNAFFFWPTRISRTLTSKSKPHSRTVTSLLPTTTVSKPQRQPPIYPNKPIIPPSPAETEITRELQHEIRLEARRRKEEFPRRLLTALFGGVAVVAPMVIMSLGRSLIKSLITSSVAMLVFGVVLAWTSAADEASLMVATAGYAAVLAVFVAVGDGD